jgi:hypothetical protein
VPWHYRDEKTDAPVDLTVHTHFNTQWAVNGFTAKGNVALLDANGNPTSGWSLDDAHQPALAYLGAVATGDPYLFEEVQMQLTQCFAATAYWDTDTAAYLDRGEDRGYAWSLRTLFMARKMTELFEQAGPLPPWVMPSRYYKTLMDKQLEQFTRLWVNNPTPAGTLYSLGPGITFVCPWQIEFRNMALNLGVLFGYSEWRPALKWAMRGTIDRVTAYPAYPCSYHMDFCKGTAANPNGPGGNVGPDTPGAPVASDYYPDYKSVFAGFAEFDKRNKDGQFKYDAQGNNIEYAALLADPTNGGVLSPSQNPDYANNCRSSLALAVFNGLKECVPPLALIDPYIKVQAARASFMTTLS